MSDRSNLIPFFDELLSVVDIVPRIRSELETVLSRMSPENPDHAKLQSLQTVLNGQFRELVREVLSNCEKFWSSCSMTNPAGYSQRDIDSAHSAETVYFESLDKLKVLMDSVQF